MFWFKFFVSDYLSHTTHLSLLEDLAHRRLLDHIFLHEKPLPPDIDEIARLIRMRTHNECITNVLQEFFVATPDGYVNQRAVKEMQKVGAKSASASAAARSRWERKANSNKGQSGIDANALQTQCERNANTMRTQCHLRPETLDLRPKTKDLNILPFCDFWKVYPRKEGKAKADQAWSKLSIRDQELALVDCQTRYEHTEKRFIPHGPVYINQKKWIDEDSPEPPKELHKPQCKSYEDISI